MHTRRFAAQPRTLGILLAAGCLLGSTSASAVPLGNVGALDWQGASSQARIIDSRPFGTGITVLATDSRLDVPNTSTSVYTEGPFVLPGNEPLGDGVMSASASPYVLRGLAGGTTDIVSDPAGGPDIFYSSNAFFRDELFFESGTGGPAVIDFDLDLSVSLGIPVDEFTGDPLFGPGQSLARFTITMLSPELEPDSNGLRVFRRLDDFAMSIAVNESGAIEATLTRNGVITPLGVEPGFSSFLGTDVARVDFAERITFSTDALLGDDGVVQSGTWLPFTITTVGDAMNAAVDWDHTLELADVRLFGDRGRTDPLLPGSFTLSSPSDAFTPFESTLPASTVPEPATVVLLGGTLLLVVRRRRRAS